MPPEALMECAAISRLFFSGSPRKDAGPVLEKMAPMRMGSAASEAVAEKTMSKRRTRPERFMKTLFPSENCFIVHTLRHGGVYPGRCAIQQVPLLQAAVLHVGTFSEGERSVKCGRVFDVGEGKTNHGADDCYGCWFRMLLLMNGGRD
jgi:hypothetical protein